MGYSPKPIFVIEVSFTSSLDESLTTKEREKWERITAYIAQTINTILNSNDTITIKQTIENLKRYIEKHVD